MPRAVILPYESSMREEVVDLSLAAWAPVFESLRQAMLPEVFEAFYRGDWRRAQKTAVEAVCADPEVHVVVACVEERVAGFAALKTHEDDRMGEVYMIAVHPDFQRRGIATELMDWSNKWFADQGMSIVMVETGGDPGHAPARRAYEAAGFQRMEVARYFKAL